MFYGLKIIGIGRDVDGVYLLILFWLYKGSFELI